MHKAKFMIMNIDFVYPIGSIYLSINSTNPSKWFGGTWVAWGTGRVPVGVDANQTEFGTVEKTGGSKYLQQHTHDKWYEWREYANNTYGLRDSIFYSGNHAANTGVWVTCGDVGAGVQTGDSGNLQPYITCYMWKRTA